MQKSCHLLEALSLSSYLNESSKSFSMKYLPGIRNHPGTVEDERGVHLVSEVVAGLVAEEHGDNDQVEPVLGTEACHCSNLRMAQCAIIGLKQKRVVVAKVAFRLDINNSSLLCFILDLC